MIDFLGKVIEKNLINIEQNIVFYIETYAIDLFWALIVIVLWFFISILVYRFIIYLFIKFKILELIDKLDISFDDEDSSKNKKDSKKKKEESKTELYDLVSKKIKIDKVVAKASSYYVFLLFFRWSIVILGITEVEQFLKEVLTYLPNLFVWIFIWYFGLRFADFIYDVVYHSLTLTKQKTAKIIAAWAEVIILFFTLMVVLNKIWIDSSIINTVLIWFISMLAIAWWLAFWLGWKEIAKEILESFRK